MCFVSDQRRPDSVVHELLQGRGQPYDVDQHERCSAGLQAAQGDLGRGPATDRIWVPAGDHTFR